MQPDACPADAPVFRSAARRIGRAADAAFGALCTAVLLALLVTTPVAQLFALGYMLRAAARLATRGRLTDAFPGVVQASQLGRAALGIWLVTLPWRLFSGLYDDAVLIDPSAPSVAITLLLSRIAAVAAAAIVLIALLAGGGLMCFVRPIAAARRLAREGRSGDFVAQRMRQGRAFVAAFGFGESLSLGVRGYLGTGAWLLVPTTLIALGRRGPLAVLGGALLIGVLVYVPFVQIHFAAQDRMRCFLDLGGVRRRFARAPLAFLLALVGTLLLALPLYVLKIELLPREALWLPAAVFLATIFPTKLLTAWAYHRGSLRSEPCHPAWRWLGRVMMLPVASAYAFVVFLTQYTGWHGLLGLYEHHAFLLPVPF